MDYLYYVFGTLIFLAVALLIEGMYLAWNSSRGPEAGRIKRRLRIMAVGGQGNEQNISIVKQRLLSTTPSMQRFLSKVPRVDSLNRFLLQSGLSWSVAKFAGICAMTALCALIAGMYFGLPLLFQLAFAGAATLLPFLYVARAKTKRLIRIEQQLPDALDLIGRALRAGHAFPTALKMVGDEMADPLAAEFRAAFDEVNFGIGMQDALLNLATRVPSTDLRYFVIAVLIQRETGGNLSELLDSISAIIRDRIKLMGQVRVLSAEGKMSGWVLSLLPFCAALGIQVSNPAYLEALYTDSAGQKMLAAAGTLMFIGILAMRKIVRIRV